MAIRPVGDKWIQYMENFVNVSIQKCEWCLPRPQSHVYSWWNIAMNGSFLSINHVLRWVATVCNVQITLCVPPSVLRRCLLTEYYTVLKDSHMTKPGTVSDKQYTIPFW